MKNRDGMIIIDGMDHDEAVASIARRLAELSGMRSGNRLAIVPMVEHPEEARQRLMNEAAQFIVGEIRPPAPAPVQAKRPPAHWDLRGPAPGRPGATAWAYSGLLVLSELAPMEAPDGKGDVIPQWLVSVSRRGGRPSDRDVERALAAFDMVGAEEDNHGPGQSRAFFMPVDPARRVACACKTDETVVTEGDGYRWSTPKDGPCAGCEYVAVTGKPCPVHGGTP